MSLRTLRQVATVYWRKRLVRILVAALVLTGAIFLQYRLTRFFPLPVDVEKSSPPYSPATAALREELVVDQPSWLPAPAGDSRTMLLTQKGKEFVYVEAYFDAARLDDDMIEALRSNPDQKDYPPEGLQQILYNVAEDENTAPGQNQIRPPDEEPCRTAIFIAPADGASLPTELHFLQPRLGDVRKLTFEMKAVGADLAVKLLTRNSGPNRAGKIQGPGCTRAVSVGDWEHPPMATALAIHIVVPAGARFGFSFTPFAGKALWSDEGGYEPFELEGTLLGARAVRKITQGTASSMPLIEATSVRSAEPLLLKHLFIRPNELQLNFSGKAIVKENGKYVATFDLWDFAQNNKALLGILTILNGALIEWIRRIAFGAKKDEGESRKPTREEKDQDPSSGDKESR